MQQKKTEKGKVGENAVDFLHVPWYDKRVLWRSMDAFFWVRLMMITEMEVIASGKAVSKQKS